MSNALVANFELINDPVLQRLLVIMGVFGLGSLLGLILFSNVIKWILNIYPKYTLAIIIGFIAGTLRLVWPWKTKIFKYNSEGEVLKNSVGNPEVAFFEYNFPDFNSLEPYGVIVALIGGAILLFAIDYFNNKKK